jgi:FAD:protein FMN transferase
MPKMSTRSMRHHFDGPTMGTRWSVTFDGANDPALQTALQQAVQDVDTQMSTWTNTSDLMRLNAAPLDTWIAVPRRLMHVLAAGLEISKTTKGAFEMNVGDAVRAWGFGPSQIDIDAIRLASRTPRVPAVAALELDQVNLQARKSAPLALDLSGIAKGYGVDCLVDVLKGFHIHHALCAIDGELRASGTQADGTPWLVAIETPDANDRAAHSVLTLAEGAVATSGDYRHFVEVRGSRLSHTIDPRRGSPLVDAPASVSVMAKTCLQADAMATALMVMGVDAGVAFANEAHISGLFIVRNANGFREVGTEFFNT